MMSLPWQGPTVTLVVREPLELAPAKQSSPFTKLAVTIPPPLIVAVTGLEVAEGVNDIEGEFVVHPVKVKVGFAEAVIETVDP